MKQKKYLSAVLISLLTGMTAVTALTASPAHAAQGDIIARVRAISIRPDVSTSGTLSTLGVDVNASTVPELDFTYMLRDHIGVEMILGTARHKVTSSIGSLGEISHLPPTITLQYHFNPAGKLRPYVGAGLNYTLFYDDKLSAGGVGIGVKNNSFGPALQIGADYQITRRFFVNVDLKKLWLRTDATMAGAPLGTLKIDPWIVGVGVGTTF